ncbi:MAG: antitoxin [Lachnospiraceae bacterium]|nr:antitoxin [Lachnospiraceae bacterium]
MRKMNKDGLLLCDLQAKAFEIAVDFAQVSSEVFIRRFMNSNVAKAMDNESVLQTNIHEKDILNMIEEQYGKSEYGSVKYTHNEMFWIGYIYRYFCYTYEMTSIQVYKIVKPKELRGLFPAYHTMDSAQAIERILEAKGLLIDEETELKRQYEIFKKVRSEVTN